MNESDEKTPILIVDDNQENLLVMNAILRRKDYALFEASSGEEALRLFEKQTFAVILLDIQMPVMDGFEVAKRIGTMKPGHTTPIIFVTAGMHEETLVKHGYEVGAVDYLSKPVDPIILRSKVKVFSDLYRAKREIEKQARLLREIDEGNRRSFLENALDAVIGIDEAGLVNYWNHQAENIFEWKKSEAMGRPVSALIMPDEFRGDFKRGFRKFLQTGEGPLLNKRVEINALRKSGEEFPVEVSVTPIRTNGSYSFSAFIRDISQRKLEQHNLKKAIKARDEFIGICSHELKTPLTSLQLHFQIADKQVRQGNPKVFERENVIKRIDATNVQLRRMARLIENMLDVTRMSASDLQLEKQELNPERLIQDVLSLFLDQLEQNRIEYKLTKTTSSDLSIMGDALRLEQVLSNIMTNAIKYGLGRPIEIVLDADESNCRISIRDNGLGIEQKDLSRIFERYERAISASEVSGLGLGLYIGQKIIKAHAGELRVKSEPGKGSEFTIELPVMQKRAELSH